MADESRATPAEKRLRNQQKLFVQEYIRLGGEGHGAEAARKAGYSARTARQQATDILSRPYIKAYMSELKRKAVDKSKEREAQSVADIAEILTFYTAVGRGEVKDQFGLDATIKDRAAAYEKIYKIIKDEQQAGANAEQNGGSQTLIIEPIYGAPEADDDGE